MQALNLPVFNFTISEENGKKYIFDEIRRKRLLLTPEEWVRQNFVKFLVQNKNYPAQLIALEMPFILNQNDKRSDIVIYDKAGHVCLLVECKSPKVKLSQKVFDQAASYNLKLNAIVLILTNGLTHYCCKIDYAEKKWEFLNEIPNYGDLELSGTNQLK